MTRSVAALVVFSFVAISSLAVAHPIEEAPSTVGATYVEPSATRALRPGEKVDKLYSRNASQDYVLQRLTEKTYWVQSQYYGTIFYLGKEGVLLFDPLDGRGEQLQKAIASVTKLPVTAIVYSHDHADHIGSAKHFTQGRKLRVIASQATADKMALLESSHPSPTETVRWPNGSFRFEDLTVELHGFTRAAHADDHGVWLLAKDKVAHLPDLVNPDQTPFWAFAGSENFVYYELDLERLAKLDWTFLSGGHGNVGSKDDISFYRTFLTDLKQAVGKAMGEVTWGTGVDASKVNAHTAFLPAWLEAVGKKAVDALRPKYGSYYGFEYAMPRNAEMVAMSMFAYR